MIFGGGTLLALAAMLWPHDAVEVQAYWNAGGMSHVFWYAAAAGLGCVGYGSVFLAVGLYFRNPIVPAAVLLAWEGVNGVLPHVLQRMSVLYYLQSLCPVPAPMADDAPTLIRLLAAPPRPPRSCGDARAAALTAFVLWIAALAVRRMQISYGGTIRPDVRGRRRGGSRLAARGSAGGGSRLPSLPLTEVGRVFSRSILRLFVGVGCAPAARLCARSACRPSQEVRGARHVAV